MNDQQDKEFGFEEEDVFEDDEVFSVEDLDAGADPVPEFEALGPGPEKSQPVEATAPVNVSEPEGFEAGQSEPDPPAAAVASPPRKSSTSRLLLLILLLVAVAAGAYFYLGTEEPVTVAKIPVPMKKPMPVKPQPQPQPVPLPKPAKPEAAPAAAASVPAASVTPPAPAEPAPVAKAEAPAPVPAEKAPATPVGKPQPVAAEVPEPAPVETASVASGAYRVQVGAYLLPDNLHETEAQVRKLGYQPQVVTGSRPVEMTRLLYGKFSKQEAAGELAKLQKHAPDAFMVHNGDQVSIYAGSYVSLDKARRFADLMFEKGVRLSEETAKVPVPFYHLSVGPLADHQAAAEVLNHLHQAGLDGLILKHGPEAKSLKK